MKSQSQSPLLKNSLPKVVFGVFFACSGILALAPTLHAQPGIRPRVQVQAQQDAVLKALPEGVTLQRAQTHVIAPVNIRDIEIEEVDPAREVRLAISKKPLKVLLKPKLDVTGFGDTMHAALKDSTNGYILQVRKNGQPVYNLVWNWAQRPVDGSKGWNLDESMHVASVSKFLTALGMVKALDQKGVSLDAKILPYLPAHWKKGNNIDKITFRHLLTHTSGLVTGASASDYGTMKAVIAKNSAGVGNGAYENVNFGLCRILIPILLGQVDKDTVFWPQTPMNDSLWDLVTGTRYADWMKSKVFIPAGVNGARYTPPGNEMSALAYKYPPGNDKGWNSGDLVSMAGGAGWRISIKQLMDVMSTARHTNTIMPKSRVQYMLDNRLGIDQIIDTPAGKTYNKNGRWTSGGRTEQCVAYFLPDGMEVAVFVNSPIGAGGASLRGLVQDSFEANLKD